MTPLLYAVQKNQLRIAQHLKDAGADVQVKHPQLGVDLLYLAASLGHDLLVGYLMNYVSANRSYE